jgi:hypothetical protein
MSMVDFMEMLDRQIESKEHRRIEMIKIAAFVLMALFTGYALYAFGQTRFDARASVVTLGSSSSNGISFAWLYDPTERTVYVCRIASGPDTLDCKAKTTLQ